MNLLAPVSSIMTADLITVSPTDKLAALKKIFDTHRIHHLPVVDNFQLVGMVSKSDMLFFVRGMTNNNFEKVLNQTSLATFEAKDIMTKGIAVLEPEDRIGVALEIFKENLFHAIPIVKGGTLLGIVTTYDIIKNVAEEG
ncbi:MAG: HPP family protein [Saprospiraceae bacterium]